MAIRIELYGVARTRVGRDVISVSADGPRCRGDVLATLTARYPARAEVRLQERQPRVGYVANIDGQRFVRDPATVIQNNSTLWLMSSDCGGCSAARIRSISSRSRLPRTSGGRSVRGGSAVRSDDMKQRRHAVATGGRQLGDLQRRAGWHHLGCRPIDMSRIVDRHALQFQFG